MYSMQRGCVVDCFFSSFHFFLFSLFVFVKKWNFSTTHEPRTTFHAAQFSENSRSTHESKLFKHRTIYPCEKSFVRDDRGSPITSSCLDSRAFLINSRSRWWSKSIEENARRVRGMRKTREKSLLAGECRLLKDDDNVDDEDDTCWSPRAT